MQEVEDVSLVLFVQREDLQLCEEQVGERDRPPGDGEPALERPHVTHLEPADEDVDAPFVLQVVEEQAAVTVQAVELMVALVPELLEQLGDRRAFALRGDEVDVVVRSGQQRLAR